MSKVIATNKSEKNGKTRFNRGKPNGVSWVSLRAKAIKEGSWIMPKQKES